MPSLDYGPTCCAQGIRGYGNLNADVMLVGIAPGREEGRKGRPFVGPSGELLNAVLESVNVERDSLYCTNLCCWVNKEPDKDTLAKCSPRLAREIAIIKPKLIVGLGSLASQVFIGRKIGASRGYVLHYDEGQDVFSSHAHYRLMTYHPSAFLQGSTNFIYDIVRDLGKINDVLTWPLPSAIKYHSISSREEAQRFMDNLRVNELVTVDIETTSPDGEAKDVFTDNILCICFRSAEGITAIPQSCLEGIVWNDKARWGFHGGIFDVVGIRKEFAQQLKIAADSMLQSYALDERAGKEYQVRIHGLGPLAGEYCPGAEFYKEKLDRKRLAQYPQEVVLDYCSHDVSYTYDLVQKQTPKLIEENVEALYENILLPAANVFADISYFGCAIDQKLKHGLQMSWLPQWVRLQKRMVKIANEAGFDGEINTNSPQQLAKLLYDLIGLPQRERIDRSVDRDHLLDLDHPFIDLLLEFRTLDKMVGTYLIGFDNEIKSDGCVHPVPLLHGTSTGRLSYQDPPIQTIPKPYRVGKDLGAFRRMFVPHNRETHCFVEVDYSQLEIWIAQALSQDSQMLADLNSGDYHGRVTTECFGITPKVKGVDSIEEVNEWGERRTQAKRVTFQRLYQGGAKTLANRHTGIGCSIAEAQQYINAFNSRYPAYNKWCTRTVAEVTENGYLQTCFGRKRRFPVIKDHGQIRQALNFPIQSIASDVCLTSLIELHWLLKQYNSSVVWTVHDAILLEVSLKNFSQVCELIEQVMTKPRHETLPQLKVEMTAGMNYYDQVPLKEFELS